jgi:hypothetical protein
MELLSKPIRLNPDMALVLDMIKKSGEPYPVYQRPAGEADEKILDVAKSLLTDANLKNHIVNAYLWYVREVARLLRTRTGRDLAFHVELVLRKWQTYGLETGSMQVIFCEIHNALKPAERVTPEDARARSKSTSEEPAVVPDPAADEGLGTA